MTTTPATTSLASEPTGIQQGTERREVCKDVLWAVCLSVALGAAYQHFFGNFNLNMRDEGYLWYGVQQVLAGEVPMLDFQSYDPGRYYWCAWLAPLFGEGIVGVRASMVTFGCLGLTAGLLVMRRFVPHRGWLIPAAIMLGLSMFPRHKLIEPAVVLIAVWSTTRLIEKPSLGRTFFAGLVVGLAAVFGRNHGLYLAIAYLALFLLSLAKRIDPKPWRSAASLSAGVVMGYSPVLFMLGFVPGFARAFMQALALVSTKGSNLVKPYRWPFSSDATGDLADAAGELPSLNPNWLLPFSRYSLDAAYMLPVVVLPVGLVVLLMLKPKAIKRHAALVAAVLVGIPYVYHYAVCSDIPHLFQAIQPVLLGALGLAAFAERNKLRVGLTLGAMFLGTLSVALNKHPELKHLNEMRINAEERMPLEVHGDLLDLPASVGGEIEMVRELVNRIVQAEEQLLILPTMPTYYPILNRRSPSWWIYLLFQSSTEEQTRIINELKTQDVGFILTIARPFLRESEYNLNETNPILWEYILRNHKKLRRTPDNQLPLRFNLWIHNSRL